MAVGLVLVMAASPSVASRIGLNPFHFAQRQALFIGPALAVLVAVSMLGPRGVRRLAVVGFAVAVALAIATLFLGEAVNGARRWIQAGGFVVQPIGDPETHVRRGHGVGAGGAATHGRSAFWRGGLRRAGDGAGVAGGPTGLRDGGVGGSRLVRPVFRCREPAPRWVGAMALAGIVLMVASYAFVPHVANRIDRFVNPSSGENYQVETALGALSNGGAFGVGPGEGVVKNVLPDAHTDFIFAVAGEEFGMFAGLLIVAAFAFIVLRGISRLLRETDFFVVLAAAGLLVSVRAAGPGHLGVNLRLLPAKGMTLPFISYGGSSILALALGLGMVLALTRRRATSAETRWVLGSANP